MHEPLMLAGDHCVVHKYHWPKPSRTVKHHIRPQEFGGPTEPNNLVLICDTGHYNVHTAIDALRKGLKPRGTREELRLARIGYEWVIANPK